MSNNASTTIAQSYNFEGQALELGTVVIDEQVDPSARVRIPLSMMNRHGLIAGATGTGKTKTLQLIAEQLSEAGVPVILADIKGDLSGLSQPGKSNDKTEQREKDTSDDWKATGYPCEFVSLGTKGVGVPIRAKISSFGPILLSKVLGLNDTQESSLGLIFKWADSQGLELYDLKDLRAVITFLSSDEGKAELTNLGGVSSQSAGVILRTLSVLESNGGDVFFGEPEIQTSDFMRVVDGKGIITLFELSDQSNHPELFSTFLMWVLADLFAHMPEVGDMDKPKLVFIFDESHTLFNGASKAFISNIVNTVKLIRSKGIGIFFCSQLPTDIPNDVLSQLGARIQHALRAFTPDDQKALAQTVKTYPTTKNYELSKALTSLGIGEAIVTVLSEKGAPTEVAWTRMRAPRSLMDDIGRDSVANAAKSSSLWSKYSQTVDSDSAYEKLEKRTHDGQNNNQANNNNNAKDQKKDDNGGIGGFVTGLSKNPIVKNFVKAAGVTIGAEITRSIFGVKKR